MKQGDIYSWSYKDGYGSQADKYWCKSQIAIFNDGKLVDTFWSGGGHGILDLERINIKYKGNPKEMDEIGKHEKQYYKPENIVDMNHPNNSNAPIYLKPGTQKDQGIMLELVKQKISENKSNIQFANSQIDRLIKLIPLVESGELDKIYL